MPIYIPRYLQQNTAHMAHDVIVFVDLNSRYADDTGRVWWNGMWMVMVINK